MPGPRCEVPGGCPPGPPLRRWWLRVDFLTAFGLMSYTEFVGGLISGNAGQRGHAERNFYEGYNRLGPAYIRFDRIVRRRFRRRATKPRNVYDVIRCGLVHEYFIKKNFVIARRHQRRNAPGLSWAGKSWRWQIGTASKTSNACASNIVSSWPPIRRFAPNSSAPSSARRFSGLRSCDTCA